MTYYPIAKAIEMAKTLQENDPEWTYTVHHGQNGMGRIDVHDEDGHLLSEGFSV